MAKLHTLSFLLPSRDSDKNDYNYVQICLQYLLHVYVIQNKMLLHKQAYVSNGKTHWRIGAAWRAQNLRMKDQERGKAAPVCK